MSDRNENFTCVDCGAEHVTAIEALRCSHKRGIAVFKERIAQLVARNERLHLELSVRRNEATDAIAERDKARAMCQGWEFRDQELRDERDRLKAKIAALEKAAELDFRS